VQHHHQESHLSNEQGHRNPSDSAWEDIARRFVEARRAGRSLPDFPGEIPPDLVTAYRVQDLAIARWDDVVVGWKIGYIAAERRDDSGDERLLGPIFRRHLWNATGAIVDIPVFSAAGGFAAVEAEYVLQLEADAPADKLDWTPQEAATLPARLDVGVEVASSPLAPINKLGPRVVVSDFGNNNGLVLGPPIGDWTTCNERDLNVRTEIDGVVVGTGGAGNLPGGLRGALAFALHRSARRGRPLKKGDLIATGNATGIHDIDVGQHALVDFGDVRIVCRAVPSPAG
jgi:2-keto-4-pentenoate hydratase